MRVAELTPEQHAACILWGASTLIVSAILKLTPEHWVKMVPVTVDEDKAIDESDPLMSAYNKQAKAKVMNKGSINPE